MENFKELAYRYDLFIAPDWRDRFDTLIDESIKMPVEGRILDVNCGTGAHTIEVAGRMHGKGEVVGVDPSAERVAIARAKALVKKAKGLQFEQGIATDLPFESHTFDTVIGDVSMMRADEIDEVLAEMVRVARPEGRVILKLTTHGSFDEFFSIYWEALHEMGLDDEVWASLEGLINERPTVSDIELVAQRTGLSNVESFISREEFRYDTADRFFESPLIADYFLLGWLEIVPSESREKLRRSIAAIIERERNEAPFEISIKATVITGTK